MNGGGNIYPEELFARFSAIADRLLPTGLPVTVALSGGADSTALLLLLARYRDERSVDLRAVHVHHGLRGEEADRDERFSARLCARLGVPYVCRRVDVRSYARAEGRGVEESARILRYRALRSAAPDGVICTAHTADDQFETLLFRIARGSGTAGLSGIPERNGRVVRPLLSFTKDELLAFLRAEGQDYMTDSSNFSADNTRSALRLQVVPALRRIFPSCIGAALRTAGNCAEDEAYLRSLLPGETPDGKTLRALPPPLLKRWILRAYARYFDGVEPEERPLLEEKHLTALSGLIGKGRYGAALSLPGNVRAVFDAKGLSFYPDERAAKRSAAHTAAAQTAAQIDAQTAAAQTAAQTAVALSVGENALPDGKTLLILTDRRNFDEFCAKYEKVYKFFTKVVLDSATISGELLMRPKKAGDSIFFGGMTRKVRELLRVRTPSTEERKKTLLLCDGAGVVWVPGFPPRQARGAPAPEEGKADEKTYIVLYGGNDDEKGYE